jgi:hypothetical protein
MNGAMTALPLLVSASQINVFTECQRKWAWKYIAKLPDPQSPAAALGTEVDETQLQPYLRDGREFDYSRDSGYIAASALAYLPKPKSDGLEVQKHFVIPSPTVAESNFGYQGFLDLWLPRGGMPDVDGGPVVVDFKTTSDLKWAKTEGQLLTDTQAQLYALWALWETRAAAVDLVWIYMQTRGPKRTKRVHVRVEAQHVADQFGRIDEVANRLVQIRRTVTDPLELPPSPSMCEAYGGCPFRHKCNLSPAEMIDAQAAKEEKDMPTTAELLAGLKAKKAGAQASNAPGSATAVTTAPAPLPPSPSVVGINPPESKLAPADPLGTLPTPPTVDLVKKGRTKKDPIGADIAAAVGVTQIKDVSPALTVEAIAKAVVDELAARLAAR